MQPYYEQDGITIYHGECLEVMTHFWGDRVDGLPFDLLLTDPPYGLGIAANPVRQAHAVSDWDKETQPVPLQHARRLARHQIIWGGNYYILPPSQSFLVWDKAQPEDFTLAMCEQAWTNLKLPAKLLKIRVVGYAKDHPTQKPEELMLWCISHVDKISKAERILDPFMGSGTTLVAAKRLRRQAVGIEREEKYCELAARRLAQGALPMEFSA